jgi:plasmid stabilization system protein ParE
MSRELVYLPAATQDFIEGKDYYEGLSPRSGGERFEIAFKEAIRQIKEGLITHAVAFEHFHRVNLGKFPYALYYRLVDEKAVIIGVLYSRAHPKRIQSALGKRLV